MEEVLLSNNYDVEDFNSIKNRFICRMKEFNINFEPKDMIALDLMINAILNKDLERTNTIYVINAACGMGKTILLEEYVSYMQSKLGGDYGCTIAKERIEDMKNLTSKYPDTHYSLYGFKPEDCLAGFPTYNPNRCRICPEMTCRIKNNTVEAKRFPILVTTHQRIQLADSYSYLHDTLVNYAIFDEDDKAKEYKRKELFIDENPSFYELNSITPIHIDIFENELSYVYQRKCKNKDKLIEYFKKLIMKLKQIMSNQQDAYFNGFVNKSNYNEFTKYEEQFKQNYYGNYFNDCMNVLNVFKYGGKHSNSKIVFPMYRALNKLPFSSIIIFDATATINQLYEYNAKLIRIPETRLFNGVQVYWCSYNNLTKNYYKEHDDFPDKIVELIRKEAANHDKTLVVTFKDIEDTYKELLNEEIEQGKIIIEHANNTKGKNSFSDCTCLFLLYNIYKGDDYYTFAKKNDIEKNSEYESLIYNTQNKVRTALNIVEDSDKNKSLVLNKTIDNFIIEDKAKDAIQEMFRIAIRKYNLDAKTKVFLFNTDNRVLNTIMEFLPKAQLIEWKPFEEEQKSDQLKDYKKAILSEFGFAEVGHNISTINFRNKYHINDRGFARYQKLHEVQKLHQEYGITRKGNFFVLVNT